MAGLRDLRISQRTVLPARLLSVRFARSGGPGGQNVDKVETKVDLRLDLEGAAEGLGARRVARVRRRLGGRIDAQGHLRVVSREHRERERNLESALTRMEGLLRQALVAPRGRKPTRPTRRSRERRMATKRRRSQLKRERRRPRDEDEGP